MSECWHDFEVAAVWCDHCWMQKQQALLIAEMRRSNDLQEKINKAKVDGYWQEPEVKVVHQYTPSARVEQPKPQSKGGMNIEPIGES